MTVAVELREGVKVKPKRGILFRTGKELRDRVNRPEDAPSPAGGGTPSPATGS